ncbi:lysozyme [Streptosporangium jomthongense]|uniref:Lysozyme n=1 Tax=Marinobacter aromaticivorans TaxID=1494078 RepID=A0ABW2IYJ5_9GAMM|nr:glycoside hydrolase family protein [Marinobacter aromaticivorans]GGE75912.1 lysozyme [Streptosporangium jomthongense]
MNRALLRSQLEKHEGLRLKPYLDTVGKLTVGYGRNLDDVGITRDEADFMLDNDIEAVERQLETVSEYRALDPVRQTVIANMCFNLGFRGLIGFKRMWAAIGQGNYKRAASEMLNSKWARQVGTRATELADVMRTGKVKAQEHSE